MKDTKNTTPFEPGKDPKSKDTSLPGREEEVVVNEQEQTRIINTDDVSEEAEGEEKNNDESPGNDREEPVKII